MKLLVCFLIVFLYNLSITGNVRHLESLQPSTPSDPLKTQETPSADSLLAEITALQVPIVKKLNCWLATLEGRQFDSKAEALETIRTVTHLVRIAGCQLLYNGQPITLTAGCGKRQTRPSIMLFGRAGTGRTQQSTVSFPILTATPID